MNFCSCECNPYEFWDISYKKYMQMSSLQRMSYLRSLRLFVIEQKRKDKSDRRLKEYLFEKFMKGEKL